MQAGSTRSQVADRPRIRASNELTKPSKITRNGRVSVAQEEGKTKPSGGMRSEKERIKKVRKRGLRK